MSRVESTVLPRSPSVGEGDTTNHFNSHRMVWEVSGAIEARDGTRTCISQDRTSSTLELLPASEGVTSGVPGRLCHKHFSLGTRSLGVREDAQSSVGPVHRASASAQRSWRRTPCVS